ncbi:MAG TPA: DUF4382 domain-containing protein [Paucimonas sp.]|nr:DUF4382 domain-containing protein [Paucimonas sp.]
MSFTRHVRKLVSLSALSASVLLGACGGGGGSSGTTSADTGALKVSLTDAPACGFEKVNVSVSKVRVHKSSSAGDAASGWQDINLEPPRKIDLLTLRNGIMTELGQTTLPAGHYTQMRLVLAENASGALANSVVAEGSNAEIALETPSAIQSGIKLNNAFDIAANATTELVLDFDACKSIVTKGNGGYQLKPVIGVTPKVVSGGITGYVTPGLSKVVVSAQQNGVVVKSTVPDATGAFTLSPMPASATSYVVVVTADGRATAAVTGVPVTVGTTTQLSTSAAPIAPPASAMGTVSGTVSPATAQATVRALQVIGTGGPTVEVGYQAANVTTGAYSLSLPVGAVSLGSYGALPITFSTTSTLVTAGKYAIEASATGYTKQSVDVDIAGTNATRNFTLTQ